MSWRVGKKVPINIYDGDRPVSQCHTAKDARRIVAAVNGWDVPAGKLQRGRPPAKGKKAPK